MELETDEPRTTDHGRTRIGFALTTEIVKKYGDKLTEADAVKEATAAVAPFSLKFKQVDWYTDYRQVGRHYSIFDCS